MSDITTSVESSEDHTRIVAHQEGRELGELTLTARGDRRWVADHTYVSPEARGQGVAGLMFSALVEWARKQNVLLIPTCSYVVKRFQEPEAPRDLLAPARS